MTTPPAPVRRIVEACVRRTLADAASKGIGEAAIWSAVQRVVADDPTVSMTDMLRRALRLAEEEEL